VELTKTTLAKVADRNTELVGRGFKRGLRRVTWELCEQLISDKIFLYVPRFFGQYYTDFYITAERMPIDGLPYWRDVPLAED